MPQRSVGSEVWICSRRQQKLFEQTWKDKLTTGIEARLAKWEVFIRKLEIRASLFIGPHKGLYVFCVPLRKSADKKKSIIFVQCSSTKSDEKADSSNTCPPETYSINSTAPWNWLSCAPENLDLLILTLTSTGDMKYSVHKTTATAFKIPVTYSFNRQQNN